MSSLGKVLLADDSPHAQRMGERILREEGYEVITVTDGETAILRVKDVDPDVVIVDAFLPQVSGYDLCGFIKKQPQHAHVHVLLTSTALERVDEDLMYRAGADGQLKKPFEASVMLKSLKDLISGSDKDSKKKRSGSTFDLGSYPDESTPVAKDAGDEESRASDKGGVSPLKAWLEQHDTDAPSSDADQDDPLGIRSPEPAESQHDQPEPVAGLSNPQLLRRAEEEPEDLSLRNNPVAKLRNVPPPSDSSSKLKNIADRAQESEAPSAPSTRSFRMTPKVEEDDEPLVKEQPDQATPEPPRQRRSLLDALAEYESEAEIVDEHELDLDAPPAAVEIADLSEPPAEAAVIQETEELPATEDPASLEPEVAAVDLTETAAEAPAETPAEEESRPEPEPVVMAAIPAITQTAVEKVSLSAAGVSLDEEEIRAAVEIAVSASMASIVDEVTRCVTMALEARYRDARDTASNRSAD